MVPPVGINLAHSGSVTARPRSVADGEAEPKLRSAPAGEPRPATEDAAYLFSETQFDRMAGSCYLSLGDHRRAQRFLDAATETMTVCKSQAIVLGNLGLAYLQQRDLDAAVANLHDAIDVLETTRGGGGLNIVSDTVRRLRSWRGESVVQDIYDRVFSLMTTT